MIKPPISQDEKKRLDELMSLDIMDSFAEEEFDDIVYMASSITGCPISLISLVDDNRQWFKARVGVNATETDRNISFCGHAISAGNDVFEVVDASEDYRFADNPLVTGGPKIRFYAGQPLITSNGYKLGTLCVIDQKPQKLNPSQKKQLEILSKQVVRLIEARKNLKDSELRTIARTQFLADMSHEIRTPLTAISGYAEIIKREFAEIIKNSKIRDYFTSLETASSHLMSLVGDVLDLSKIDSQLIHKKENALSIGSFAKDLISVLSLRAKEKHLILNLHLSESLPGYIFADETLLKQVLVNLISNAVKFTEAGSVNIEIDFDSKNSKLNFLITDTGIGISPKDSELIFRPFQRTDLSLSKKIDGTGLGLSISKGITEVLGGTLTLVSSEIGKGSEFLLSLPVSVVSDADVAKKYTTLIPDSRYFQDLAQIKRVLVIDDSEDNRFIFTYFLKAFDLQIDEAESGAEALSQFDKNTYDVVFVDMKLPDIHGQELYKKLKSQAKGDCHFVAFTASSTSDERQLCFQAGFSHFLSKPFSRNDLIRTLTELK